MNKKSCLALVLVVLMVASLFTGCAAKEPEAGTVTPTPTEAPTEAPVESNVSLGRMEGGVYTNSYTGYGCTLDSNWVFQSAEELQELPITNPCCCFLHRAWRQLHQKEHR